MMRLKGYLKPFLLGLAAAIALLFVQALCDLNLPNYMSDIVNVGIQQSGVEHASPDAISKSGMAMITNFMTDSEKSHVLESYSLTSSDDKTADGKMYRSIYPNAGDDLYIRGALDAQGRQQLDTAFGTAAGALISIMKEKAPPAPADSANMPAQNMGEIDLTRLYPFQAMLTAIPKPVLSAAHEKAASSDERLLNQSGVLLAKAFYKELGADISGMQTAYITRIGLIMLLIALLGGAATVLVSFLAAKIATGAARNLRRDVFDKIESFSSKEFDKFGSASLITRCTNDITQMQQLAQMGIRMMFYAPIMGIGGIIMAIDKSASMTWILGIAVVAITGMIAVLFSIALPRFKIMQKLVDKLNLVSRENLSGLMVIRAFGTQPHEKKRFDAANAELTGTNLFVNRLMSVMMPMMMIIMNGLSLLIIWVGAGQIAASSMQVGDMMAYMQYAMQVLMSFMMLSMMFIFVPRAAVSAARITDVLETGLSIRDPASPGQFAADKTGLLEFENVRFRYDGAEADALSDITFTARPAQTTAIIGSTGSGKSTVASLILRLYDVSGGRILVDGTDIREVTQKDLRAKIGYVPQKGILLSGSVSFNLKYGKRDATDQEMETAAAVAQAGEFILERPDGFDAQISQSGTNVSGGQKQRLSIARAIVKNPEILIFDDSFSALDFKTDVALRKALKEHTGQSTVIIIAQRISSIMNAQQILVLEEGRIVGRGTHQELLKTCKEYWEMASSQLGEGETA